MKEDRYDGVLAMRETYRLQLVENSEIKLEMKPHKHRTWQRRTAAERHRSEMSLSATMRMVSNLDLRKIQ